MAHTKHKCPGCGSKNLKLVRVTPTSTGPINSYICQSCGVNTNLHVESGVAVNVRRRKGAGSVTQQAEAPFIPVESLFAPKKSISAGSCVRTIVTISMIILLVYVFIL